MAKMGKHEEAFRAKYTFANVRPGVIYPFEVYAGDYLCAEGRTVAVAFKHAYEAEARGDIKPDPYEQRGDFPTL